jgi:hypothetical protein
MSDENDVSLPKGERGTGLTSCSIRAIAVLCRESPRTEFFCMGS